MAKFNQGILGGFSGKIGNVVGSTWKSISYMRAVAANVSNPNTEKQQCQRGRFRVALRFLNSFTPFIRVGYKGYAVKCTPHNAAMSYVLKYAVSGCGEQTVVDYEKALVSRGALTMVNVESVSVSDNKLTVAWTDNSGRGDAQATDVAMLLAYNKQTGEAVWDTNAAARVDGTAALPLPEDWDGLPLVGYLSFRSENGIAVSNSVCLLNDVANGDEASGEGTGDTSGEDTGGSTEGGEDNPF